MKTITAALLLLALALPALGQLAPTNKPPRVLVEWGANPEANVAGYKVYDGTNSRSYQRITIVTNTMTNGIVSISDTNAIITNFVRGITYYFAATAFNTMGLESDFSEEAVLDIPALPAPPAPFQATNQYTVVITAKLEEADDPAGPWNMVMPIDPHYADPEGSSFFRMVMGIDLLTPPD